MEKKKEATIGFRVRRNGKENGSFYRVWGLEGTEKKMETTVMGYIGATVRIHSFIPS